MIRDTWSKIVAMCVCLVAIAVTDGSIPNAAAVWAPSLYGGAAVALLVWRATRYRNLLTVFGALLVVGSVARAVIWVKVGDHIPAASVNMLVAVYTFGYVRDRPNGRHEET